MKLSKNIFSVLFGFVKIIEIVIIIIIEVRLNIKLKLFLMKTPIIKIEKIDRDKKISGNIIFKLAIIFNLKQALFRNLLLNYQLKH